MSDFLDRLRRGPCLLLDGGLGSELIARGLPSGMPPEGWTLERPGEVVAVHRAYVEAGSDAVHANTFGANAARLERFGLRERIEEVNRTAIRLAREAGATYVVADIGPTGEYLPPVGRGTPDEWRRSFSEQGAILATAVPDAFHVETMTDVREALAALEALREAAPSIPVLVSLTFEQRKKGFFTIMGDPLGPSLARLEAAGAAAVGANCTITSAEMSALARDALHATGGAPAAEAGPRLVLQPNAGSPRVTAEGPCYGQTPEEFAQDMAPLATMPGVAALGGCCGTDPRFIAALRARFS